MGFTHKGKLLGEDVRDDFNEDISQDSDDERHNRQKRKGFLNEEMVEKLNFGGGEEEPSKKKTRKEVFEEIIEKSRSYDAARKEMKQINVTLQRELDGDFQELMKVIPYAKPTLIDPSTYNDALIEKMEKKAQESKKKPDKKKASDKDEQSYD